MNGRLVPELPPSAPRAGTAFGRWVGRTVLRLGGWRMVGEWPDVPRLVIIAVPHSSAWDAVWGLAAKAAMGLGAVFMAKAELFRGPLGRLLRRFGGEPVDRTAAGGVIEQVVARFDGADRFWFALAPEGTRRRVEKWKPGFWKIAKRAGVPVFCVWFHYPDKVIGLGPLVEIGDDMDADLVRIKALFAAYRGKHRGA